MVDESPGRGHVDGHSVRQRSFSEANKGSVPRSVVDTLKAELLEKDLKVKRLRQEKLGLLLKCFSEMLNLLETLRGGPPRQAPPADFMPQRVCKIENNHPAAKDVQDSEDSDDSIIKLTGRLEQVFESFRCFKNKGQVELNSSLQHEYM